MAPMQGPGFRYIFMDGDYGRNRDRDGRHPSRQRQPARRWMNLPALTL